MHTLVKLVALGVEKILYGSQGNAIKNM